MKTFDGKEITRSWAVIDDNGEEFISAVTILFSAAGDVARAKRIAQRDLKMIEGGDDFKIELRSV
jgi:hypothetical protein